MMQEAAYAKVNLFLDVLRKRPDGYHDIGTLFQTVGVCDLLQAELLPAGRIELVCDAGVTERPEQNLVWRAAKMLQAEFPVAELAAGVGVGADAGVGADERVTCLPGCRIVLEKRLPAGAGLGGGSADAAAALRLLNRLWGMGLPPERLEALGAQLGADVPFLVRGGTAFAEGIGERLTSAPSPRDLAVLILTPECHSGTREAYASLTPSGSGRWEAFRAHWSGSDPIPHLFNKFEESVPAAYPPIARLLAELRSYDAPALLSGSGASVLALLPDEATAHALRARIAEPCRFAAVTRFKPAVGA
jgi:4-diphosphocytidyl-2-C-methyl-D-erythritol kinase